MSTTNDTVTFGRTISKNYQSQRVEVTLQVAEGWHINEVYDLAIAMAQAMLGLRVPDRRRANELLRAYYNNENLDIEDYYRESQV